MASGQITAEQGLIYKVFAAFRDPRLPSQFAGPAETLGEAPLDDVTAQWNQLSPGAQATLGPFLIPPMQQGSYWEQLIEGASPSAASARAATASDAEASNPNSPWCTGNAEVVLANWSFVEATSGAAAGKVRVWYQNRFATTDAARAGTLLSAIETKIWPSLTTLMQREPLPDGGSTESCAGGSDALDIALVDADEATTIPTVNQENSPVHIVFPRAGTRSTPPWLGHEFMHALQYTFTLASGDMSSGENRWLKESTAQWAQDYVSNSQYGTPLAPANTEHLALQHFFPFPQESLDDASDKNHAYGKYVFWIWAARKGNDPTIMRQLWNAVATQKSLDAAKSLFGGGWAQAWKDFERAIWNDDPIFNFQNWDQITDTPKVEADTTLPGNTITPVITTVGPVAAKYFTFKPAASGVNDLTYKNIGGLSDEAGIQAIINYKDGSSTVEDWTQIDQQDVPFCNIDKLTLVLSNASITPSGGRAFSLSFSPPSASPHAAVSPRAQVCLPNPQGSFSGTAHYDDTVADILDWSWSGNVVFEANGQANAPFPEFFGEVWDNATVKSGSVTMSAHGTVTGTEQTCEIDVPSQSFTLGPGDGSSMTIQPGPEPHYGIQLFGPPIIQGNLSCPDGTSGTASFPAPGLIYTPDPEQTMTRGTYAGSATFGNGFFDVSFNWNLGDPSQ